MELLDVVDENDKLTGNQASRDEVHDKGLWHRSVHIWIYSKSGKVLLQLRNKNMKEEPNLWDISVAGHISAGQDPDSAAVREAKEEIGLDIDQSKLKRIGVLESSRPVDGMKAPHNQFLYIYLYCLDETAELHYTDGEVKETRWVDFDTLDKEVHDEELRTRYVLHTDVYFDFILKELRKAHGD